MRKLNKVFIFLAVIFSVFLFGHGALAAKFYISPQSGAQALNKTFTVDIKIDSQGDGINAAQAKVIFPADKLEIKIVDKTGSVFGFWPEEPTFSNENGVVDFIGGTVNGVSGASLHILRIVFNAKSVGETPISLDDGAITVDDGTGTNILTEIVGANYRISVTVAAPLPAPEIPSGVQPTLPLPGEPIPPPVIIEREPELAKGLPEAPNVFVPLYPDPNSWYNITTPFNATWSLPLDITDVSTIIDINPNFQPQKSEKLFDNKIFNSLPEGVSYLHVRFKNKIGWGPAAHYRLAVDTAPPAPFIIESSDGFQTDNPMPLLQFGTSDALSGISHYLVKIGDAEAFEWKNGQLRTPLQSPGTHRVSVKALDLAGNGASMSVNLEILAIGSPAITFTTEKLFFGTEEGVMVRGTALPNIDVRVFIEKEIGGIVAEYLARSNKDGNWDVTIYEPLGIGSYVVLAQARDLRGALSLVVKSDKVVKVKSQPIIKLGAIEIGSGGSAVILLIILVGGFGAGYWYFRERQKTLRARVAITSRDYAQLYKLINSDIEKLTKDFDKMNETEKKFILDRAKENIQKIEKYLLEEVRNIGDSK
ncbi:MAG: hypothetical protein US71_C0001G0002 [Parcubacteria group bacterium GW2011_GWD2_38_12]|nr:MAG: hypothetical protein US71_C0001G0002 [Parcubacteria group bacterium GW2011_GWD2_38_12]KKQ59003.1 MAG: hypothetical protein US79_C0001G0002 [Parcubacteria group bacterium GW2011_GWC1_38_17]KKQ59263.1 MAG: hypothetical protein US78_C0007G0023 [Parcubacteria group bacterium GW2011_GWD1_38_16]